MTDTAPSDETPPLLELTDYRVGFRTERGLAKAVDGVSFSSPGGIQIKSRGRESGPQKVYQQFYIYNLLVGVIGNMGFCGSA